MNEIAARVVSATTFVNERAVHRPRVIQTEHLDADAAAWLAQHAELIVCAHDDPSLPHSLTDARGMVVRTYTIVNEALLERAPQLRVVGRAGVGLDNIDVDACRARHIEVVYTPDANTQAVVEYVVALMFDHIRPRMAIETALPVEQWNLLRARTLGLRQANELTVGILGLGRVGRGVARACSALGSTVLYNDVIEITASDRHGGQPVELEDLFRQADVLSIHIDGRASNRGFVNQRLLALMKPDALLLNTARGFVVDNLALVERLRSHPAFIACLDVHEPEPFGSDYPLLGLPNVRLFPHLASRTATAMSNMSWVVRDVLAVLEGREPRFPAPR